MGFLVSSVAKRDPVGRKPKRKVFAAEGLVALEREAKKVVEGMYIVMGNRRCDLTFPVPQYLLGRLFLMFVSSEVE